MPIVVACQCGKRFKAGDQFAGKRTRCPGCGQPLTIPAVPAPPAPPRPVPPQAREPVDLLSLGTEEEVFQPAAAEAPPAKPASRKVPAAAAAVVPPGGKRKRAGGPVAVPSVTVSPMIVTLIVLA